MKPPPPAHRIVRINYAIRAGAFAYCFLVLGTHGWERGYGAAFWALLSLQFFAYPHLAYLRARMAKAPKDAEIQNMYLDAGLLGAWAGALQFPVWIAYAALFSTTLNGASVRGVQGALWSFASFAAGAALAVAAFGLAYQPATSDVVTGLCFFGSLAYSCAIGYVMYRQNRSLIDARDAMHESEARYRLLAEHAADLVALVDPDGRWLYASPSYGRLLDAGDLEAGVDAFRRVHPDDGDLARIAVLRAASTRKPRDIALRLVDRDGRIRQLKTRIQPVNGDHGPVTRLALASHDVTDLRESEERMLIAAHALEGMTEAIVVTGADGTVLTVNRAFTDITGYTRDEVLGTAEKAIRNALQPPEFYDEVYAMVQREGYWSGTTWSRRKTGAVYREWRSIRAVRNAEGRATHYVTVFYEVGAPRSAEEAEKA